MRATDQEVQIPLSDRERRRGQGSGAGIEIVETVHETGADEQETGLADGGHHVGVQVLVDVGDGDRLQGGVGAAEDVGAHGAAEGPAGDHNWVNADFAGAVGA